MSKTTSKVKRKLINDIEEQELRSNSVKRSRVTGESENRQLPRDDEVNREDGNRRSRGKFVNDSARNGNLTVQLNKKNDKRKVTSNLAHAENNNAIPGNSHCDSKSRYDKVKGQRSKFTVPALSFNNQTRSRVVKPPARFIDSVEDMKEKQIVKRTSHSKNGADKNSRSRKAKFDNAKKVSKNSDPTQHYEIEDIDNHTLSEIAEGSAIAVASTSSENIEHDGVKLSINGSDIDEFSDEEDQHSQQYEPGAILTSDEEEVAQVQVVQKPAPAAQPVRRVVTNKDGSINAKSAAPKFQKFYHLKDDPEFNEFLDVVLDKKLSDRKVIENQQNGGSTSENKSRKKAGKKGNEQSQQKQHNNLIKSPSDTTLYSPGLRLIKDNQVNLPRIRQDDQQPLARGVNVRNGSNYTPNTLQNVRVTDNQDVMIENISNIVYNIRISVDQASTSGQTKSTRPNRDEPAPSTSASRKSGGTNSGYNTDSANSTERCTDQLLLQAEKFKARVEAPKGRNTMINSLLMPYDYEQLRTKIVTDEGLGPIDREILFLRNFDQDDEFFHVTSQIDPGLKAKIERGEFVDLERLLPKDKFSSNIKGMMN